MLCKVMYIYDKIRIIINSYVMLLMKNKQKRFSFQETADDIGLLDKLKIEAKKLKRSMSNHILYILSSHVEKEQNKVD